MEIRFNDIAMTWDYYIARIRPKSHSDLYYSRLVIGEIQISHLRLYIYRSRYLRMTVLFGSNAGSWSGRRYAYNSIVKNSRL